MVIKIAPYIKNNFNGLQSITLIWEKTKNAFLDNIILDFSNCKWFEANFIVILGGIIDKIQENINNVELRNIPDILKNVLQRNEFLYQFGYEKLPDYNKTVIKYKKFSKLEGKQFKDYIDFELLAIKDFPSINSGLAKKINESLFEIFENAKIHGKVILYMLAGNITQQQINQELILRLLIWGKQ